MRILLTNDDGIDAPGIAALYRACRDLGEVFVVAPAEPQSASSHAITLHRGITARRTTVLDSGGALFEGFAVGGKPADCVKLGVARLVPGPIDLVLSGINAGANIGINVLYSGTVSAAMEAAIQGFPAVAVSLHIGRREKTDWAAATGHARRMLLGILAGPLQRHSLLNVNIPILDDGAEPDGVRVLPISTSPIVDAYSGPTHEGDAATYNAADHLHFQHTPADSDVDAIFRRHITVTPLHFDVTDRRQMPAWKERLETRQAPAANAPQGSLTRPGK